MANKITQLVNESGDNLYPLAGGMAADSIGTEMLKDGSVTSDKIDWTTMSSSAITVTKNSTYVGNVESASVRRTGNLVEFHMVFTLAADVTSTSQTLFSGFPAPNIGVCQFVGVTISNSAQSPIRIGINSAGDFKNWYNVSSYVTSGKTVVVSGSYFTS